VTAAEGEAPASLRDRYLSPGGEAEGEVAGTEGEVGEVEDDEEEEEEDKGEGTAPAPPAFVLSESSLTSFASATALVAASRRDLGVSVWLVFTAASALPAVSATGWSEDWVGAG
jgi:hypothetical protein